MVHHIYIYGVIGWEATAKSVIDQITAASPKKDDTVIAHIHSPGGYVSEGYAIHDALKSQSQSLGFILETQAEGECKSIATVIFLSASTRKITSNADFMIHNPWGGLEGDASDLRKYADDLEQEEIKLAKFYADKTGGSEEDMRALMAEETFYTAKQAIEMGFATEEVDTMKAVALFKVNQSKTNNQKQMSKFNLKAFKQSLTKALEAISGGEPLALDTTLEDGTAITIGTEASEPAVGDAVTFTDSGEQVPDGSHTLTDGSVIVTVDGVITEINPEDSGEEVAALQAEIADLKQALAEAQPILDAVAKAQSKPAPKAQTRVRSIVKPNEKPKASFSKEDIKSNRRRAQA